MSLRRILILHNGALGDCVLALHLAQRVRAAQPQAIIAMAARSPIVRWAKNRGLVDEAHLLDEVGAVHWHLNSPASEDSVRFLRSFDCIVSMLGGPDESITHRIRELSEKPVFAIDPKATSGETTHIVEQWANRLHNSGFRPVEHQSCLRHFGITAASDPSVGNAGLNSSRPSGTDRINEATSFEKRERLSGTPLTAFFPTTVRKKSNAVFHPGSGGLKKVLPIDEIERLADIVRARGSTVVWMVGPDEMERDGEAFIERLSRTGPVIAEEDVCKAADLVDGADEFIGFDAGMTHVAAMAGVPTTAIFGPTDPRVWRPLGSCVRVANFENAGKLLERVADKYAMPGAKVRAS